MKKMHRALHIFASLLLLLGISILPGCSSTEVTADRDRVQWAEKKCATYDCYMERLGKKRKEITTTEEGNLSVCWYMSVRKIRPLEYGEEPRDGMYYRYYDEDCRFTAIFDESGNVLETEWEGPGCWGDGL